jgi:hypothetical protein
MMNDQTQNVSAPFLVIRRFISQNLVLVTKTNSIPVLVRTIYIVSKPVQWNRSCVQESFFVDNKANTQPKIKDIPIAAVRYVIGGKSYKITLTILITIKMAQIEYAMRDIISVAFLDIGYFVGALNLLNIF